MRDKIAASKRKGMWMGGTVPLGYDVKDRKLVNAAGKHLLELINSILDLSKIEAGRLELESAPFDLQEMLVSLHRAYSALANHRGLALTLELDPALPRVVQGDALRVRQILVNPKYIGDNVYNRVSFKLKKKRVVNPPEMWIRREGAFAPVVSRLAGK